MTIKDAMEFVKERGVVLESARGPVPSMAETIVGGPIRGSWWGHSKGRAIWKITSALRESSEILVCRLVDGKVTFVHRRLWPALVKLSGRIDAERLAAIREVHLASGKHEMRKTPFPEWAPREVVEEGRRLEEAEAVEVLGEWIVRRFNDTVTPLFPVCPQNR